ncbi:insulinase family protein [candidate division KSB1 bacterium]|nr:insulinase family protein [candidate division KSB1 bacterium]
MIHTSLYSKTELENGLRIVTEEIPHVRSVALGVWITVGSRDENANNNGISHFIEHMLFKGTRNRTTRQIAESLEKVGGSLDAFTTKELTCYSAHVLDEHLLLSFDVLADILTNSLFDPTELEKEKEVILNEINHYKDTPDEMVFEHFYQNVFPAHPLGFPVYGTKRNVKLFTRKQLLDFFRNGYATNRIVISAAGHLKHKEVVDLIQDSFTGLPENKPRISQTYRHADYVEKVIQDKCTQAHVCLGTLAYPYTDDRKFPLMVINTYLGGGMSSLLFQKVREELGLVYSIFSFLDFSIDNGLFGIYFSSDKRHIDPILDLIKAELKELSNNTFDEQILTNLKNQLKGNLMLGLESTMARMNRLAKNEIYYNRHFTLDDILEKIDRVSVGDVCNVANELYGNDSYFTTVLKPMKAI